MKKILKILKKRRYFKSSFCNFKIWKTIETLTNTFLLNILKKNAKNIILISEKKIMHYFFYLEN